MAVLVLLLEGALTTGNRRLVNNVVRSAPLLLLLAFPFSTGPVHRAFLDNVTQTVGSPLWLTVWMLIVFLGWARWRGERAAAPIVLGLLSLLSVIGPATHGVGTLSEPGEWPLALVGTILLINGVRTRSSVRALAGAAVLSLTAWLILPDTPLAGFRMTVTVHLFWLAVIVLGLLDDDRFARALRMAGALAMPLAAVIVMLAPPTAGIPAPWRVAYVTLLAAASIAIALRWHSRWYLYAFTALMALAAYGVAALAFRAAAQGLGRGAVTAFAWSTAALLTAVLISAHKAQWLPTRLLPPWTNGHSKHL